MFFKEIDSKFIHIKLQQIKNTILTFLPTQTGIPIIIAGTAIPAIRAMPTGAPTSIPNCHIIFFLRLHGFLPQNVQPDGLKKIKIFNTVYFMHAYMHLNNNQTVQKKKLLYIYATHII